MKNLVFITGNQHKADYLAKWLGLPIEHQKLELAEIQSLDSREVVDHKVQQAYAMIQRPVLIEDVSLVFNAMGKLPGTFIKWFLEELKPEGLCNLAAQLDSQAANNSITYALYDGETTQYFEASQSGTIKLKPRGTYGFGWNPVFVPDGSDKTYAEMTDDELWPFSPSSSGY